jgi:hypothetical protein
METCILAKILILLAIISYSLYDCIAETFSLTYSTPLLLLEIFTTVVLVLVTNYYCEHWIAKAIVIYAMIGTIIYVYVCVLQTRK